MQMNGTQLRSVGRQLWAVLWRVLVLAPFVVLPTYLALQGTWVPAALMVLVLLIQCIWRRAPLALVVLLWPRHRS